jgi:FdhE protein
MKTIEQLKQSTDLIMKSRPAYQNILKFYEKVFEAQEKSKSDLDLAPIIIQADLLDLKKENEMPLISPDQFQIDVPSATKLLISICDLAIEYAPNLSLSAHNIKKALKNEDFNIDLMFSAILENKENVLKELTEYLNIPTDHLMLFGIQGLLPSIQIGAQQLESYLSNPIDDKVDYKEGYCPICGTTPDLGILDEKGKRHLKCGLCSHQWATQRMGCVFCKDTDPEQQHYFFSDDEKEYRVSLCDNCHQYLKVIDLRQMNRFFYPSLELISTLHLDMKATEKGYVKKA